MKTFRRSFLNESRESPGRPKTSRTTPLDNSRNRDRIPNNSQERGLKKNASATQLIPEFIGTLTPEKRSKSRNSPNIRKRKMNKLVMAYTKDSSPSFRERKKGTRYSGCTSPIPSYLPNYKRSIDRIPDMIPHNYKGELF